MMGKGWENSPSNEALLQRVDVQAMKLIMARESDKNCGGVL